MMVLQAIIQLAGTIIFVVFLVLLFSPRKKQKLPENPGERLETFARIATRAAEHLYPDNPGQKDLAIAMVIDFYKEWDLPTPSKMTISRAVSAESLMLPKPVDG